MVRHIVFAVASVWMTGCAVDEAADEGSVEQATTTNCSASIVRYRLDGPISTSASGWLYDQSGSVNTTTNYKGRCTPAFSMSAGDRHVVKAVGANSGGGSNPLSLRVDRSTDGGATWTTGVKSSRTANTSNEFLDYAVATTALYRVCAVADDTSEAGTDYIRLTSDKVNPTYCGPAGSGIDGNSPGYGTTEYCFGAVGAHCRGNTVSCSVKSNAKIGCPVSVGSHLHDQCCAHNPGGYNCGGGTNVSGWASDCTSEWDHAQNDVTTTRYWTKTFDPTVPFYRSPDAWTPTTADTSGDVAQWTSLSTYDARHRGKPTAESYLTPVGKPLWDVDAQNGWCTNSSKYKVCGSVQGNYAVCCDSACGGCSCSFPNWNVTSCK